MNIIILIFKNNKRKLYLRQLRKCKKPITIKNLDQVIVNTPIQVAKRKGIEKRGHNFKSRNTT